MYIYLSSLLIASPNELLDLTCGMKTALSSLLSGQNNDFRYLDNKSQLNINIMITEFQDNVSITKIFVLLLLQTSTSTPINNATVLLLLRYFFKQYYLMP